MQNELQISSAAVSDRGLSEKRPQNEDSYVELRESGLFAVADGVGGAQAGEVASQMAMEILAEAFINLQEDGDAESRMQQAIERANSAIFQMSHDLPQLSSMATTVVALHINGNIATIGHVGDSRLYRLHPNGELVQETLDHSVVEEEVRAGRMTPEQAAVHPSRNVISRALGAEPLVDIDMKTVMVEPNTTFIACSDGVTRHISDAELRELLINAPDTDELCRTIKDICYERGAEDNLTAVIVRAESAFEGAEDEFPEEFEEDTIATARDEHGEQDTLEIEDEGSVPEEVPVQVAAAAASAGESISMSGSGSQSFLSILSDGQTEEVSAPSQYEEPKKRSRVARVFGTFLLALVMIAAGGAAGAAGMYYYSTMSSPAPQTVVPDPPKIELTSFEQAKMKVYEDPVAAIATLSANPQNAEDHYFLGLAYLLNARYEEAGVALTNASGKLPDYDPAQRANLSKEIALAKSVVDNPAAREAFTAALAAGGDQDGEDDAPSDSAPATTQAP